MEDKKRWKIKYTIANYFHRVLDFNPELKQNSYKLLSIKSVSVLSLDLRVDPVCVHG